MNAVDSAQRKPVHQSYFYFISALLLAVSLGFRLAAYNIVTSDYTYFVAKWFDDLKSHPGLTAFQTSFSDYSPLYLYFIKLLTFIPVYNLWSEKTLSFVFDLALAYGAYLLVKHTSGKHYLHGQLFFVFAVTLSIPTVVVNTSLWGQSDSIYAAGIVFSLYFILRDKPLPAVFAFAYAMCIKLQAGFFLPIIVGYYLRNDLKKLWQLILIPILYVVSIVPAWLGGGSFRDLLFIYSGQAREYTELSHSAQSVFAYVMGVPLSPGLYNLLLNLGLALAAFLSYRIVVLIASLPKKKYTPSTVVFISTMCVLLVPYLLPRMHERYFYLADVFSTIYAFYAPRRWYLPVAIIFSSFLSYMPFLSSQVSWFSAFNIDLRIGATIILVVLSYMAWLFYSQWRQARSGPTLRAPL